MNISRKRKQNKLRFCKTYMLIYFLLIRSSWVCLTSSLFEIVKSQRQLTMAIIMDCFPVNPESVTRGVLHLASEASALIDSYKSA
ncbi:hypothetical protein T01_7216 [Trichinella spiralis]|uniref:Uncharacterized protein n=1 Tax=Trichinella spiralis TaxID=6334 RepID=A0A0V1BM81_TRISP|nr:hypothetical protein T01_7216 [Trichinella spiralis]